MKFPKEFWIFMIALNVILGIFSISIGHRDMFTLNFLSGVCCYLGFLGSRGK